MNTLINAGATNALIVGGYVRDKMLGIDSKDIDIEVYGLSLDQIKHLLEGAGFKVSTVGKAFGVLKIDNVIDVSVPRRENKVGVGHKGFNVEPDPMMGVEEAASRRDFTINSMAMDINGNIIDPFKGLRHLFHHGMILRHTSDAFVEDPLRVLRGMQFASRFRAFLSRETVQLCKGMKDEFHSLPKERIWEEWKKWALKGKHAWCGLLFLVESGWISNFPELDALRDVPQDAEWHPEGCVWIHTCHVVDAAAKIADREQLDEHDRLVLMFAALTHDFGKPSTTKMEGGRWRSKRHSEAGVELAEQFLVRIGAPVSVIEQVKPLVREHLVHAGIDQPSDKAIRRLAHRLAPASVQALGRVIEADHSGRPPLPAGNPFQHWVDRAIQLDVSNKKPQPILMGRHLIEMGMQPGKEMGKILDSAFEAQLEGMFLDLDGAKKWLAK